LAPGYSFPPAPGSFFKELTPVLSRYVPSLLRWNILTRFLTFIYSYTAIFLISQVPLFLILFFDLFLYGIHIVDRARLLPASSEHPCRPLVSAFRTSHSFFVSLDWISFECGVPLPCRFRSDLSSPLLLFLFFLRYRLPVSPNRAIFFLSSPSSGGFSALRSRDPAVFFLSLGFSSLIPEVASLRLPLLI